MLKHIVFGRGLLNSDQVLEFEIEFKNFKHTKHYTDKNLTKTTLEHNLRLINNHTHGYEQRFMPPLLHTKALSLHK